MVFINYEFTMKIGIIGGSGLENPEILKEAKEIDINTIYGKPTSFIFTGKIYGIDVCIISRHGRKHEFPPSQVNYRANISALKELGCTHIIATSACGSLREEIKRGILLFLMILLIIQNIGKQLFMKILIMG